MSGESFLHGDTGAGAARDCNDGAGKGNTSLPCGLGADSMEVPGASASSVSVVTLWNSSMRWLLKSRAGALRAFFHSSLKQTHRDDLGTPRPVWPMPLPFFHKEEVVRFGNAPSHLQKGLTSMVVCVNWLHLGKPYKIPEHFNPAARLTGEQRSTVHRLIRLMTPWSSSLPVSAADMGRTAAKVENIEATIELLKSSTATAVARLGSSKEAVGKIPDTTSASLLGEVQLAKKIESARISFAGKPTFDPSPLLDEASRKIFCNPLEHAVSPEDATEDPPRVNARGDRHQILGLLRRLDKSGRLFLCPPGEVRMRYRAGLFSLLKNLESDRLILDCRPANALEPQICNWVQTMGAISPLLDIKLQQGCNLIAGGEDLRDYYYYYRVSDSRAKRNSIAFCLTYAEAKTFDSFPSHVPASSHYIPCLRTLAMGDVNAVEIGQESHLKLCLLEGLQLHQFVTLRGKLPRGLWAAGVIIDDFIVLQQIPKSFSGIPLSSRICDRMVQRYASVGLVAHDKKRFRQLTSAKFWGIHIDGERGLLFPQIERSLPIAFITSQVCRLGYADRKLLEVLSGAWVSMMQCRRRCMCLMQHVFYEIQQFPYKVVFQLSKAVIAELWTLVLLAPVMMTDLRAPVLPLLSCVDASSAWMAEVSSPLPQKFADELTRHKLTKAAWSRLLSPWKEVQRIHNRLLPEDEVPDGEVPSAAHPVWSVLAQACTFRTEWRRPVRRRRHINLSELESALLAELRSFSEHPSSRLLMGCDSQVSLGALVKGRSSSPSLNKLLQRYLPGVIGCNGYSHHNYLRSAENTADDPTRDVPCRPPAIDFPSWLADAFDGNFEAMDEFLVSCGLGDAELARLPFFDPSLFDQELETVEPFDLQNDEIPAEHAAAKNDEVPEELFAPKNEATEVLSSCSLKMPRPKATSKSLKRPSRSGLLTKAVETPPVVASGRSPCRVASSAQLSSRAIALLTEFPEDQFVLPPGLTLQECFRRGPGHLDLFSGSRGLAKQLARATGRFVLTFDIKHSESENLEDQPLRRRLSAMVDCDCFCTVSAGPVCSSFSRAVRPPVRSASEPWGVKRMTATMRSKVEQGNNFSSWLAMFVEQCCNRGLVVIIENPHLSYLWWMPEWKRLANRPDLDFYLTDYCRWQMRRRKRARFFGNFSLVGSNCLCRCETPHIQLKGYSNLYKMSWTRVAEPYPTSLCRHLAASVAKTLQQKAEERLDNSGCAKTGSLRVGEAKNPGPRPRQSRTVPDLEEVTTVQQSTLVVQRRALEKFSFWLVDKLSTASVESLHRTPSLQVHFLRAFGNELYRTGEPMYLFRHLIVWFQQNFPQQRHDLVTAWELLSRWEQVQPVTHRVPVPKLVIDAVLSVSVAWGWLRFAALTALAFHGAMRIGEPITAVRGDLILPDEAALQQKVCFLRVSKPKPGRRGRGRIQHARIDDEFAVDLAVAAFTFLDPSEKLFAATASTYRRRWDRVTAALKIPASLNITPGGLRGGGAVHMYHRSLPVSDILWRMRLRQQTTLESYLQETATITIIHQLPKQSLESIKAAASMLPFLMRPFSS